VWRARGAGVTAFFVPGVGDDSRAVESAYGEMRRRTELGMGRRPTPRRILSLWTRRGALDCITQVGRRDPLRGGTVIAIFDMGRHQPFVVWWQQQIGCGGGVPEVVGNSAYAVEEFDA
jgi:hypothetical protein